jgi:hypothetical protein
MEANQPNNQQQIMLIIRSLAVAFLFCVATECILGGFKIKIPDQIDRLAFALSGALGAMLVKTTPTEATKPPQSF